MEKNTPIASVAEWLSFLLIAAAMVAIQVMIGGTRLVFSLPSYCLLGAAGLFALFSSRRVRPFPSPSCLAITTIFFAYILGRAILSPVPYITRSDIYSVLGGLVVYFFTATILTSSRRRMLLIVLLLALAMGHVLVGAIQFRGGANYMPISWLQRYDYGTRASGFYVCPNHLAGLLEALGVLGLSLVCWSRWSVSVKLLVGYAVGLCYVGLVLSGSRGGYISTAVSLVTFVILSLMVLSRAPGHLAWKVGAGGMVAAILLGFLVTQTVKKDPYLTGRAQSVFETTNMRRDLWQGALQQWKLQPLFGTGSGTYLYYGRFFRTERVQQDPINTHNDYLHLLAEYGLAGAAGMALFLATHLWRAWGNFTRLGPKRVAVSQHILSNALALNIGATAAIASYLVHSVLDFNLHIPANLLLMAFVFGLLANEGVMRERDLSVAPRHPYWWLILPVLGIALIVQCVRLFPGEYFSEHARTAVRDQQPALGILNALRGLKYDPQNPDLYYHLGQARSLLASQMEDEAASDSFRVDAIAALQTARTIAPQDEVYALALANAFDSAQRFEEAEWAYYDALQLDPKSSSVRRYYELHLKAWTESGGMKSKAAGSETLMERGRLTFPQTEMRETLKKRLLTKLPTATLRAACVFTRKLCAS